jgi:hypothetical protein
MRWSCEVRLLIGGGGGGGGEVMVEVEVEATPLAEGGGASTIVFSLDDGIPIPPRLLFAHF